MDTTADPLSISLKHVGVGQRRTWDLRGLGVLFLLCGLRGTNQCEAKQTLRFRHTAVRRSLHRQGGSMALQGLQSLLVRDTWLLRRMYREFLIWGIPA